MIDLLAVHAERDLYPRVLFGYAALWDRKPGALGLIAANLYNRNSSVSEHIQRFSSLRSLIPVFGVDSSELQHTATVIYAL